jgi:hypothetical protein
LGDGRQAHYYEWRWEGLHLAPCRLFKKLSSRLESRSSQSLSAKGSM